MKVCPFCAEEIQDAAIVCKHCGRDLAAPGKVRATPVPTRAPKKPMGPLGVGCLLILGMGGLAVIAVMCNTSPPTQTGSTSAPVSTDLAARVNFDGIKFTVKNEGATDWLDVRCTLNRAGFFGDGYEYRVVRLDSGESFQVGARQFAKPDGTRFNPIEIKPTSMAISAKINSLNGPQGFFHGAWK